MSERPGIRIFEMTLDRPGFLRLLPGAVGGEPFQEDEDGFVHREPGRLWRIRLVPLPAILLGPIPMARLRVELAFEGMAANEAERFVGRFLAHFQRCGG
jgi:hypothetical protein